MGTDDLDPESTVFSRRARARMIVARRKAVEAISRSVASRKSAQDAVARLQRKSGESGGRS